MAEEVAVALAASWEKHLTDDTLAWLSAASPADVALAISLGSRCIQALPELSGRASNSSAEKGAKGEAEIYDLLCKAHGSRVRDVSRRAHSGDLVCDSRAGPIYIEVKHYTNTVPSAEVDKFLRDLRERDAAAGVMLSLTSSIVGQRNSFSVALESRVSTGTVVPVVYASAGRSSLRLHADIALAAVEIAICLAEVYPCGVRGLHSRDTMLTYATAADQLADGAASVRTELARLASSVSSDISSLSERVVLLGRETRDLARGLRTDSEDVFETGGGEKDSCEALAADFIKRYSVCVSKSILLNMVHSIESNAGIIAGILGEENRWRLLKDRAVHVNSGCSLAFLKGATELRAPASYVSAELIVKLLKNHGKKVKLANGELSLELDDSTLIDAMSVLGVFAT